MSIQIAVDVSDLHCGSDVGLLPPDAESDKGNAIGMNLCQQWLWSKWEEMQDRALSIIGNDEFALFINGDATEGIHHRSPDIVATRIGEHVRYAASALRRLSERAAKIYVVAGTECHTLDMETVLAGMLQAEGGKARDKWLVEIHGCLIDAAHHMGVTSRRYLEASGMGIALGNARLNYADAGHRIPRVFLRGHRHCGGWYSNGHAALGVTGGWQFLTRHGMKVVTDSIPHPSALVLDWRGQPFGALPQHHLLKFDPPPHETAII